MRVLYLTSTSSLTGGAAEYSNAQIKVFRGLLTGGGLAVVCFDGMGDQRALASALRSLRESPPVAVYASHVNLAPIAHALAAPVHATVIVAGCGMRDGRVSKAVEWSVRHAHLVTARCHAAANRLMDSGFRLVAPTVIWDCVDLDRFNVATPSRSFLDRYGFAEASKARVLLASVRSGVPEARGDALRAFEVFASAARHVPELCLLLSGCPDIADELGRRSRLYGLERRCVVIGQVSDADLPDLLRASTILWNVESGHPDGIATWLLAALASGLPAVAAGHGSAREAVIHRRTGCIVQIDDTQSQVESVVQLARDHELREVMSRRARELAVAEFGFPVFFERHERLLDRWFPVADAPADPAAGSARPRGL